MKLRSIWFLALSAVVLVLLGRPAPPPGQAADPLPSQPGAPFLGDFFDIWVDTANNENQELVYNPDRDEYLAVWVSKQADRTDVWARPIDAATGSLGSPIQVASLGEIHFTQADAAYSPMFRQYLVVMTVEVSPSDHNIWAVHFDDDGSDISSAFPIDTETRIQKNPAVVYNSVSDLYLVVYENKKTDGNKEVVGRHINAETHTLVGSERTVLAPVGTRQDRYDPAAAFDPNRENYLISYSFEQDDPLRAYAASKLISSDLNPGTEVDLSATYAMDTEIGYAGGQYLVVWSAPELNDISARRVNYDGLPLGTGGGFRLSASQTGLYYTHYPRLALAPHFGYLAVWHRFDGTTSDEADLQGNIIFPGLDQPAGGELSLDDSPNYQDRPAIACGKDGRCLLSESCNLMDYLLGDREIRGRWLYPPRTFLPLVRK